MQLSRGRPSFSGSGKSSGFLKGSSIKSRRNKKYRVQGKKILKGVVHVAETGTFVTDSEVVFIGHSMPMYNMKYCAYWAVLRNLLLKAGVNTSILGGNTVASVVGISVGDNFFITYKTTDAAVATSSNYVYIAADTIDTIVKFFADNITWSTATTQFLDMTFVPVAASPLKRSVVRLNSAVLHFQVNLDLKIQNRTVSFTSNDTSEDVDNQPVFGKMYEGPGLGFEYKNVESIGGSWSSNANTGIILTSASSNNPLQEPLDYQAFKPVTKIGKVHLDPGQLKTSRIDKTVNASFQIFMTNINPQLLQVATAQGLRMNGRYARYRIFAIERMLDVVKSAEIAAAPVTIAAEHNAKIICSVTEKFSSPTAQLFIKTRAV